MHYIIHALDRAGALVAEDNATMIGSFFLVEADRREDVEAFHRADPFRAADIWEHVSIHPFLKRQDNRA